MSRSWAVPPEFPEGSDADPAQASAGRLTAERVRYVGVADWWGRHVWLERDGARAALPYSEGAMIGFAWGRAGLGARELARSILRDATGGSDVGDVLCTRFVHEVIVRLPQSDFELGRDDVLAWLALQP